MYRVEYSDVIGRNTRLFVCIQYEIPDYGFFEPITALYFLPYFTPRNVAKRRCE